MTRIPKRAIGSVKKGPAVVANEGGVGMHIRLEVKKDTISEANVEDHA